MSAHPRLSAPSPSSEAGLFAIYAWAVLPWIVTQDFVTRPPEVSWWLLFALSFAAAAAAMFAVIGVHEFGHFAVGRLVGLTFDDVVIGAGRTLANFRFAGARWHLRLVPASGYVRPRINAAYFSRLGQLLHVLGGPLVEGTAAAVLLLSVWPGLRQALPTVPIYCAQIALWMFVGLSVFTLLQAFWPRQVLMEGQLTPNDGLLIRQLLQNGRPWQAAREHFLVQQEVEPLVRAGRAEAALTIFEPLLSRYPDLPFAHLAHCHLLCELGQPEAGLLAARRALSLTPPGHPERTASLDVLASTVLFYRLLSHLPEADIWTAEALTLSDAITLRGTRGSVLLELGRTEEGEAMLREVIARSTAEVDQAISHAYLARLAQTRGQLDDARRLITEALARDPAQILVRHIASELGHPLPIVAPPA